MRRTWLLIFGAFLLLWTITAQTNHYLSGRGTHLFVGALFITVTALRLPVRGGLLLSAAVGLLCDATTPVPPGTHLLLFAAVHALICQFRHRVPADLCATQLLLALAANAALYLALSSILIARHPLLAQQWPRLGWDLLWSEVFIALIGPWFFALQGRVIDLDRFALREHL
ncbi:MAG: hypothetical protein IT582_03295 [Opitutaceae bacterium]|nr:hypothetical protein [Opitutaceae bacterium]